MRTLLIILLYTLAVIGCTNTGSKWTEKRTVTATITEKWEDWSGEAQHPYKVLFGVSVRDENGTVTTYKERGWLDAREWNNAVAGETQRQYVTSLKDLGVPPTDYQKSQENWNTFYLFCIFMLLPILALGFFLTYDGY